MNSKYLNIVLNDIKFAYSELESNPYLVYLKHGYSCMKFVNYLCRYLLNNFEICSILYLFIYKGY